MNHVIRCSRLLPLNPFVPRPSAPNTPLPPPLQKHLDDFLIPDPQLLLPQLAASTGPRFRQLNGAMGQLLDEYSLVAFLPLDIQDEDRWGAIRFAYRCVATTPCENVYMALEAHWPRRSLVGPQRWRPTSTVRRHAPWPIPLRFFRFVRLR